MRNATHLKLSVLIKALEYSSPFFHTFIMVVFIYKIDYKKIKNNILNFNKNDYLVVKSNAYGFGIKKVIKIAYECGMRKFCFIELKDALYINRTYPYTLVLLLGPLNKSYLNKCIENEICITVTNSLDFDLIKDFNINYQIEINSGMNRFGLNDFDYKSVLLDKRFKGVYSHNATNDINHINDQLQVFFNFVKFIVDKEIHFASSSIMNLSIPFTTSRRIGCAIYEDSLEVSAKIISINFCKKESYVGYDYTYQLQNDGYIGVIDIGYADGLERNCDGFLVYMNGKYFPLIGKACMNHSFVLLDSSDYLNFTVMIIGKENNITNYVKYFKKIPHEIYLSFLKRY